jgi:hypothetical protein
MYILVDLAYCSLPLLIWYHVKVVYIFLDALPFDILTVPINNL